jgi:hypothetical protein
MLSIGVDEIPPGASSVRAVYNRGTGYYCQACLRFIVPVWIRQATVIFPACRVCFEEELLKEAHGDVAILANMAKPAKASDVVVRA